MALIYFSVHVFGVVFLLFRKLSPSAQTQSKRNFATASGGLLWPLLYGILVYTKRQHMPHIVICIRILYELVVLLFLLQVWQTLSAWCFCVWTNLNKCNYLCKTNERALRLRILLVCLFVYLCVLSINGYICECTEAMPISVVGVCLKAHPYSRTYNNIYHLYVCLCPYGETHMQAFYNCTLDIHTYIYLYLNRQSR